MRSWYRHAMALASVLLVMGLLLAGCGSSSSSQKSGTLTIAPSAYGSLTANFNPFSANVNSGTQGLIYETLLDIDQLNGKVLPWLADTYQYSSDGLILTFHLHHGVTWSDGKPFTSADVAFTLNLSKQFPAIDNNALWQTISSVSTPDDYTVVVNLKRVNSTLLWYLGYQTYMVPQHIWSSISNPATDPIVNPVGTGPFKLKSFSSSLYVFEKVPTSWQAGNCQVSEIRYPAFGSNASADMVLASGQIDWAGVFSTDMQKVFVQPNPKDHHIWSPPKDIVTLFLNLSKPLFKQLAVRQAISAAIDRNAISQQAEQGLELVASPTGIDLPTFTRYLNPDYANQTFGAANPAKADTLLEGAGFKKGSDGIYADASGKRISFQIEVPVGWSDWDAGCQIIADSLKAAGMDVSVNQVDFNSRYLPDANKGNFDALMHWTNPGPTPYYLLNQLLNSQYTAAAGQSAPTNFAGWQDPATDQYLAQYVNSLDPTVQQEALNGLEKIMVEQVPTISLVEGAGWNEYSTVHFTGWPSADDPYAFPAPWQYPDVEHVVLHLKAV
jgi:peptide/nickel transport system substrate-binding protein